jgi:hypothetical protein
MKQELQCLRSSVEAITTASVESAHDTCHAKDNYYRLAYQTVRTKTDLPSAQFRSLLLRLIGDKDHEKVFAIVSKVEKSFQRDQRSTSSTVHVPFAGRGLARAPRCYYCRQPGHFQAQCMQRRRDFATQRPGETAGSSSDVARS